MTESIKVIASGILAGLVVLIGGSMFGAGPAVGGVYELTEQYFEGGIDVTGNGSIQIDGTDAIDSGRGFAATSLDVSGTATTSIYVEGVSASCLVMKDAAGTVRYFRPNESVIGGMGTTTAAYCGY